MWFLKQELFTTFQHFVLKPTHAFYKKRKKKLKVKKIADSATCSRSSIIFFVQEIMKNWAKYVHLNPSFQTLPVERRNIWKTTFMISWESSEHIFLGFHFPSSQTFQYL